MLTIQTRLEELRRIPVAGKFGLAVVVMAGVLDVAVHLMTDVHAHHHAAFGPEQLAHLLGIAGMVFVLAGVVVSGARRQLRQRAARNGGLDNHAHR